MFFQQKYALAPVVAVALLMVVSVTAVLTFQTLYSSYSSELLNDVESRSQTQNFNTGIEMVTNDIVYFNNQNENNLSITKVSIEDVNCNYSSSVPKGIHKIDVSSCMTNLSKEKANVVVYTNKGIYSQSFYVHYKNTS